jgi:hypothetical protein
VGRFYTAGNPDFIVTLRIPKVRLALQAEKGRKQEWDEIEPSELQLLKIRKSSETIE